MQLKPGVSLIGVQSPLILGLIIAEGTFQALGLTLVVTSITDGQHAVTNSLHYKGLAADLRLPQYDCKVVVAALKDRLGAEWDVVLEATHIHMEFDPKVKTHEATA